MFGFTLCYVTRDGKRRNENLGALGSREGNGGGEIQTADFKKMFFVAALYWLIAPCNTECTVSAKAVCHP